MRPPRNPFHPSEILLEEFLKPAGLTQAAFAARIGWTRARGGGGGGLELRREAWTGERNHEIGPRGAVPHRRDAAALRARRLPDHRPHVPGRAVRLPSIGGARGGWTPVSARGAAFVAAGPGSPRARPSATSPMDRFAPAAGRGADERAFSVTTGLKPVEPLLGPASRRLVSSLRGFPPPPHHPVRRHRQQAPQQHDTLARKRGSSLIHADPVGADLPLGRAIREHRRVATVVDSPAQIGASAFRGVGPQCDPVWITFVGRRGGAGVGVSRVLRQCPDVAGDTSVE